MANQAAAMRADGGEEASLRAEIARLKTDLATAAARIAELEFRADIDPLTGARNRQGFERELKRSLAYVERYGTPAALIYFDLDGFKAINDRHGHAAGDAVLKAVTAALIAHVRASDVVARLGGDEFAVLMWNADAARAQAKAGELGGEIARTPIDYIGPDSVPVELHAGVSCGVAELAAGLGFSQVLDAADRAMYAHKQSRPRAATR